MTYSTGGPIAALDYNTFATLTGGMNEVFSDTHSGATTLPNAGFGYGQVPALSAVSAAANITAAQWASLFQTIRKSGGHQGTTVVPPLPVANPVAGDDITAYNTLPTLVTLIRTNRFNLAVGQSTLTAGTSYAQPGGANPWTNTLTWNYQVNFGSWNNARYFFNSGGKINLNGSNPTVVTPEDIQWNAMLTAMSPLVFNYTSTTPNVGLGGTSIGFYDLTTAYQTIYFKTYGSGYYYLTSSITVQAKYNAAAGTNGLVDFRIILDNNDPSPNAKTSTTTYRVDNVRATGPNVSYPGGLSVATVGANSGFVAT